MIPRSTTMNPHVTVSRELLEALYNSLGDANNGVCTAHTMLEGDNHRPLSRKVLAQSRARLWNSQALILEMMGLGDQPRTDIPPVLDYAPEGTRWAGKSADKPL